MTITLKPWQSLALAVLLVAAAAALQGCVSSEGSTAEFWRHMERNAY